MTEKALSYARFDKIDEFILSAFIWFFIPSRRTDIQDTGFYEVYRTIGLYFDPSFFTPSVISMLIFVILIIILVFGTIISSILIFVIQRNQMRIPKLARRIVQILAFLITNVINTSIVVLFTKPITCFIPRSKSIHVYCNNNFTVALQILCIITLIFLLIFGYFYSVFSFEPQIRSPNPTNSRKGLFNVFSFSITSVDALLCTLLIDIQPIITCVIHITLFSILLLSFLIYQPLYKKHSSQITAGSIGAGGSGAILGLLLQLLQKLSLLNGSEQQDDDGQTIYFAGPLKPLAIVLMAVLALSLPIVSFIGCYILEKALFERQWILKPVRTVVQKKITRWNENKTLNLELDPIIQLQQSLGQKQYQQYQLAFEDVPDDNDENDKINHKEIIQQIENEDLRNNYNNFRKEKNISQQKSNLNLNMQHQLSKDQSMNMTKSLINLSPQYGLSIQKILGKESIQTNNQLNKNDKKKEWIEKEEIIRSFQITTHNQLPIEQVQSHFIQKEQKKDQINSNEAINNSNKILTGINKGGINQNINNAIFPFFQQEINIPISDHHIPFLLQQQQPQYSLNNINKLYTKEYSFKPRPPYIIPEIPTKKNAPNQFIDYNSNKQDFQQKNINIKHPFESLSQLDSFTDQINIKKENIANELSKFDQQNTTEQNDQQNNIKTLQQSISLNNQIFDSVNINNQMNQESTYTNNQISTQIQQQQLDGNSHQQSEKIIYYMEDFVADTPLIIHDIVKHWNSVDEIEPSLRFLTCPEISFHQEIIDFVAQLHQSIIRRERFMYSSEERINYSLFLHDFQGDAVKMSVELTHANEMQPSWTNRWISYLSMKELERLVVAHKNSMHNQGWQGDNAKSNNSNQNKLNTNSSEIKNNKIKYSKWKNKQKQSQQYQGTFNETRAALEKLASSAGIKIISEYDQMAKLVKIINGGEKEAAAQSVKDIEANNQNVEDDGGGIFSGEDQYTQTNQGSNPMLNAYYVHTQLAKAERYFEIARGNASMMWSLLTRRNVDVARVMQHASLTVVNAGLSRDIYSAVLENHSDNPTAIRQYATLLRFIYCDEEMASLLFKEADSLEDIHDNENDDVKPFLGKEDNKNKNNNDAINSAQSTAPPSPSMKNTKEPLSQFYQTKQDKNQINRNKESENIQLIDQYQLINPSQNNINKKEINQIYQSSQQTFINETTPQNNPNDIQTNQLPKLSTNLDPDNESQMQDKIKKRKYTSTGIVTASQLSSNFQDQNSSQSMTATIIQLTIGLIIISGVFIFAFIFVNQRFQFCVNMLINERDSISVGKNLNSVLDIYYWGRYCAILTKSKVIANGIEVMESSWSEADEFLQIATEDITELYLNSGQDDVWMSHSSPFLMYWMKSDYLLYGDIRNIINDENETKNNNQDDKINIQQLNNDNQYYNQQIINPQNKPQLQSSTNFIQNNNFKKQLNLGQSDDLIIRKMHIRSFDLITHINWCRDLGYELVSNSLSLYVKYLEEHRVGEFDPESTIVPDESQLIDQIKGIHSDAYVNRLASSATVNFPYIVAEELKMIVRIFHNNLEKNASLGILILSMCFLGCILTMILTSCVPMIYQMMKIIKNRKSKLLKLCITSPDEAQKIYDQVEGITLERERRYKEKMRRELEKDRLKGKEKDNEISELEQFYSTKHQPDLKQDDEVSISSNQQYTKRSQEYEKEMSPSLSQDVQTSNIKNVGLNQDTEQPETDQSQQQNQLHQEQKNILPFQQLIVDINNLNQNQISSPQTQQSSLSFGNKNATPQIFAPTEHPAYPYIPISRQLNVDENLVGKQLINNQFSQSSQFELVDQIPETGLQNFQSETQSNGIKVTYSHAFLKAESTAQHLQREQRIEDLKQRLKHLNGIIPRTVQCRLIWGIFIIIISVSTFFILTIVYLEQLPTYSALIIANGFRQIVLIQISELGTLFMTNELYPLQEEFSQSNFDRNFQSQVNQQQPHKFIQNAWKDEFNRSPNLFISQNYTTPAIINSSYISDRECLRDTLGRLIQMLNAQTQVFHGGQQSGVIIGDEMLDGLNNRRVQGNQPYIQMILTGETNCLMDLEQTREDTLKKLKSGQSPQEIAQSKMKQSQRNKGEYLSQSNEQQIKYIRKGAKRMLIRKDQKQFYQEKSAKSPNIIFIDVSGASEDDDINEVCSDDSRLPGISMPFFGLVELLQRYIDMTMRMTRIEDFTDDDFPKAFEYVAMAGAYDISAGLVEIGDYFQQVLDEFRQNSIDTILILFIMIAAVIFLICIIFIIPVPSHLSEIGKISSQMQELINAKQVVLIAVVKSEAEKIVAANSRATSRQPMSQDLQDCSDIGQTETFKANFNN